MENRIWRRTMVYTWAMFLAIVWTTVGLLYQVTNDLLFAYGSSHREMIYTHALFVDGRLSCRTIP